MDDIQKIAGRPAEYLAGTGLPQLSGGSIFFFVGSAVLVQNILPKTSAAHDVPLWVAIFCEGAMLLIVRALKNRVVAPRGGYVELQPRWGSGIMQWVSLAIALAMAALAYTFHMESRLVWPAFAVLGALICVAWGRQVKSSLLMWFALYVVCLAPLLWWMPLSNLLRGAWFSVAMGAPIAVIGVIRLRGFLRTTSMPVETTHE
jgi:hypothetical protein